MSDFNPSEFAGGSTTLNVETMKTWGISSTIFTVADIKKRDYEARDDRPATSKLVLVFDECEEELPLNPTNNRFMMKEFGAESTNAWIGKKVVATVDARNPSMAWIALSAVPSAAALPPRPVRPAAPVAQAAAPKPAPRPIAAAVPSVVDVEFVDPFAQE